MARKFGTIRSGSGGEVGVRAVLYTRVSSEEQSKGYSLRQQLERLQEYCQENNYQVVGAFEDRSSGAYLDRPGLDSVRDVVSTGSIDVVLAQDRDRFSREPAYLYILREEFLQQGTKMRALNDQGDDSPEGELSNGILDQLAKFERAKTAERTRRGRLKKALEGKIPGTGRPPYGFCYADDHYHIDEERMVWVRDIFRMIANGKSAYAVTQYLKNSGAPSPGKGGWRRNSIRNLILNDCYLGTYWFNREKKTRQVSYVENGERKYKTEVYDREIRPREEWIPIRVPDSGITPETIARARERIEDNKWLPSRNSERIWELSGGMARCSQCGHRLTPYSTSNSGKNRKKYFYYRCPNRDDDHCSNRKNYPAHTLEEMVSERLASALQPDTWREFVDESTSQQIEDLRRMHRADPNQTHERLLGRMTSLQTKIYRVKELFIDGDLSRPEYEERKSSIQEEIEGIQQELSKIDDLDAEIKRIEVLRYALLSIENPFGGHYVFIDDGDLDPEILDEHHLSYGSRRTAAQRRLDLYRNLDLHVRVGEEMEITLDLGGILIGQKESLSG